MCVVLGWVYELLVLEIMAGSWVRRAMVYEMLSMSIVVVGFGVVLLSASRKKKIITASQDAIYAEKRKGTVL